MVLVCGLDSAGSERAVDLFSCYIKQFEEFRILRRHAN